MVLAAVKGIAFMVFTNMGGFLNEVKNSMLIQKHETSTFRVGLHFPEPMMR